MSRFDPVPLTQRQANAFIAAHHRHHQPSRGDVFRVALALDGEVIAVATVGRRAARRLNDGRTLEVNRLCVVDAPESRHAASKLYAMAWRVARELGYRRLLTYTMADETGVSLVAAGWCIVYQTPGRSWSCPSRPRDDRHPLGARTLWEMTA